MNTPLDKAISQFDQALRAVTGAVGKTPRQSPASSIETDALSDQEKTVAVRLMRVNHCGEVCAQALYQAQALVAKSPEVANHMRTAAIEEVDHLSWTEERIRELDGHVSYLNPFWYLASFGMGAVTGMLGDKINLGFVAATEDQVAGHLDDHLERLPKQDKKSQEILRQMRTDELAHKEMALSAGGTSFPKPIKQGMRMVSNLMKRTTYWI
ncbi:MAG: 2-polyprenyl-3-methyl-6-methoxy-1,4-benzoquinone monooxygenase [Pseudomonadales bacterium]|nr:2-polyprenyl-3-methyl-6-methoxy-1,4-benzoquinone monooxygenase [Pseudomonadales bacterium]